MSVIGEFRSRIDRSMPSEFKGIVPSGIFCVLGFLITPISMYIHEAGHALAMKLLYQNVKPQIILHYWGFGGGVCMYGFDIQKIVKTLISESGEINETTIENTILSSVGKLMGKNGVETSVSAAGPLVEAFYHAGAVAGTDSGIIAFIMLPNSLALTEYALSALWLNKMPDGGHDFYHIWQTSGTWAYIGIASVCVASTSYVAYKAFKQAKKWGLNIKPRGNC